MSSGSLRTVAIFAPPIAVNIAPSIAYGFTYFNTPASATIGPVNCTVTGGQGPYQYLWQYVSGDAFTVTSQNSAITYFYSGPIAAGFLSEGVYRCTVTDTFGQSATDTVHLIGQNQGENP